MTTLYYYHKDFLLHNTGSGHPESAARLNSINAALEGAAYDSLNRINVELRQDIHELIRLVHRKTMMNRVLQNIEPKLTISIDQDTLLSEGSSRAALLAVSAVCDAVDKICNGQADNAFCAVRPPGHHAGSEQSMGFCLFNNVAIAAEYAIKAHKTRRIAIIDFDVHHGNGTQQIFYNRADVFYASSHEMPNFPGTGYASETGVGNIFNAPLAAGDSGIQFREKYSKLIFPALKKFNPELILLSAGFDAHKDDPLSLIQLTAEDFKWITDEILRIAEQCCNGRIISVLEGGYNLDAIAKCVSVHIASLMGLKE